MAPPGCGWIAAWLFAATACGINEAIEVLAPAAGSGLGDVLTGNATHKVRPADAPAAPGTAAETKLQTLRLRGIAGIGGTIDSHVDAVSADSGAMSNPPAGGTLHCASKVDLVVLFDGSTSLEEYGWAQAKRLVDGLLGSMVYQGDDSNVAVIQYSGPSGFDAFNLCSSGNPARALDLHKDCGIQWVKHFTTNVTDVRSAVRNLEFPGGSSFTYMALGQANAEIIYGRQDAPSVVLVISGGNPLFEERTRQAAQSLKSAARLVWVAVGKAARDGQRVQDMKSWASLPWQDNLLLFPDLNQLATPLVVNEVVATTCHRVR
mmetsp:Transcript_117302/g.373693  ORF Transcript_117302/g.373693 Transcript_117302/m.373693 type:complete len:319 (+) Transcript_117302:73-1029(+)